MPTKAEQNRILAKLIGDLYELKKEYSYRWHYTCGKSVPDDYREAMDGLLNNAKRECGLMIATHGPFIDVWLAFERVDTPLDTEAIRLLLRKKVEIELDV
ncbi:hypothetical protein D9M68_616800 [compost metagenome]